MVVINWLLCGAIFEYKITDYFILIFVINIFN